MAMIEFTADGAARRGYLALPAGGHGHGVLVLHAWWGLTPFFQALCDRLAAQGYMAFAPDLHQGKTAQTIEQAQQLMDGRDFAAQQATAEAALGFLRTNPAVRGDKLATVGFSMGADFAILLDSRQPAALAAVVLFYGGSYADVSASQARFLAHFAEVDEWEPLEQVRKMKAPNLQVHVYPGAGHWFFEDDRPPHFAPDAARLAWQRTLAFLSETLGT